MDLRTDVEFSDLNLETAQALLPVARKIFTDTFAHLYEREAFETFCDQVYAADGPMAKDFRDSSVSWQVACSSGTPIGYAKLTPLRAPVPDPQSGALELQQIYVLAEWHGSGVAERLMRWAVAAAKEQQAPELYLTVFDHNHRAKRFYSRHGFVEIGQCTFILGNRVDDDRIWRKDLVTART